MEGIAVGFAYKSGQKCFYDGVQLISSLITQDTTP